MSTRKDRLRQAYECLRTRGYIHTKKDLAAKIGITQPALYAAFGGNEAYLTDNLFVKICAAFPAVFSLEYLITGDGALLLTTDEPDDSDAAETHIIEIYAKVIKDVELLNHQLKEEIAEVRRLKEELVDAVSQFRKPYKQQSPDYPLAAEAEHTPKTTKNI